MCCAPRLMEQAREGQPRSANVAHGLAHIAYETGDIEGGARYLEGWLPAYERASALHCHLSWHLALFELERGRTDVAMRVYEDSIAPGALPSPPGRAWPSSPRAWALSRTAITKVPSAGSSRWRAR